MFFRWLLNLIGLRAKQTNLLLLKCPIHGSQYYECLKLVADNKLYIDEKLVLRRNQDNAFDERAIEVWTKNKKMLGHIPKKDNKVIASLLDQGKSMQTRIVKIENVKTPVTIKIYLKG